LEFLELELVLGGLLGHGFSRRYTCKTQRLRKWRNFDSEKKWGKRGVRWEKRKNREMKFSLCSKVYILTHIFFYP
jgi:hypothetical protein